MAAEGCEGRAIEEEESLGGSARCCSRGGRVRSGCLLLVMAQKGNLVVGQAELGIGDGIGWRCHGGGGYSCTFGWAYRCGRFSINVFVVIDKGNDTLTENCEGGVRFMVIEMGDGS